MVVIGVRLIVCQLRTEVQNKEELLRQCGYEVRSIWECEWHTLKRRAKVAVFVKTLKCVQPRRQLSFEKIIEGIQTDDLFGLLFVDVETPADVQKELQDFPVVIKNCDISRQDIGPYMQKIAEDFDYLKKPKRFLIASHHATNHLISTDMLKFYLQLGLKINKIHQFIQFYPSSCFEKLAQEISNSRRRGDADANHQIMALTSKLQGNSLYSATLLNKGKHRQISYCDCSDVNDKINSPRFQNLDVIQDNLYEVSCRKSKIINNLPIQVGLFVYLNAKLHLLKFFHLFIRKFLQKRKYCLLESDTDSCYFALSETSLDDCVHPHLRREYFQEKAKWIVVDACEQHMSEYIDVRTRDCVWQPPECCIQRGKYLLRESGLFKVEHTGVSSCLLGCKSYCVSGDPFKQVSKGVSVKQNPLTLNDYVKVLETNNPLYVTNRGFQMREHQIYTYSQRKRGLNSFYCKRKVLADGINTVPLDI